MKATISKQQWLDWINEQEQGDLSIADFCRKKINTDNFYYHISQHRKKLSTNSSFIRAQLVDDSTLIKNPSTVTLYVGRSCYSC
jgi:hypothetical protein